MDPVGRLLLDRFAAKPLFFDLVQPFAALGAPILYPRVAADDGRRSGKSLPS